MKNPGFFNLWRLCKADMKSGISVENFNKSPERMALVGKGFLELKVYSLAKISSSSVHLEEAFIFSLSDGCD